MVLARRPDRAALTRLDLLVAGEPPDDVAVEVPLDQLQRLLVRRTRAARGDDEAARQNTRAGPPAELLKSSQRLTTLPFMSMTSTACVPSGESTVYPFHARSGRKQYVTVQ